MSLYTATNELRAILEIIEAFEDGELPSDIETAFDAAVSSFEERMNAVLCVRANMLAAADGIEPELSRLAALKERYVKRGDFLKAYVYKSMQTAKQKSFATRLFKLRIQKNSRPSIYLAEGSSIPKNLERVVTTTSFDGTKAYEMWKTKQPLPPEVIVSLGSHLRIE